MSGTFFRAWAPDHWRVEVLLDKPADLASKGNGYFSALVPDVIAGARYANRLDGEDRWLADPASRFQPKGPRGRRRLWTRPPWADDAWRGVARREQVTYEMHVGTFSHCRATDGQDVDQHNDSTSCVIWINLPSQNSK